MSGVLTVVVHGNGTFEVLNDEGDTVVKGRAKASETTRGYVTLRCDWSNEPHWPVVVRFPANLLNSID